MPGSDAIIKVSLFQNLHSTVSVAVRMEEVLRLLEYDKSVELKTQNYRHTMAAQGKALADEQCKQKQMPAISVAVLFDGYGRKTDHMLGFTGLAMVDLDHVAHVDQVLLKALADPHTVMAYRTVSGQGLHILYRYQRQDAQRPLDVTSWRAAFLKGNRHYQQLTGCQYDAQCGDYTRLSVLAHDERVRARWDAQPFIITDSDIIAANFDGEQERGKARREHPTGTYKAQASDVWPKVEQALQRKGLVYQSGHHHDYVMHAAFLMNRYGVDMDELMAWAAQEWTDYNARERNATIRSCYKRTADHGTWRLNLPGKQAKETSMITLPEIRQWLHQHVEVTYNMVTDISMWRRRGSDLWHQLDERVLCSMRSQMAADTGKRVLKNDVTDVLHSDFARLFHPVREYVDALPQWDRQDRVDELCSHLTAVAVLPQQTATQAQQRATWMLHKWMVAMVATWMSDAITNHEIFVLIGRQGIYKTTFFRHLLPPPLRSYFAENAHNSLSSKDDHLAMAENCMIEMEELDMQSPRDISELKALVTSERVKERRPYARFPEAKHRLASFAGSGNQDRFLTDDTGSRRFLCVKVSHIDDPRQWGIDYDQLYAQLRDEWRQGFRYWFDADEQRIVEQQNQAFRVESDEEQLIRTRLRIPKPGEKVTLMNAASIAQFVNGGVVGRGVSSRKISLIMVRMGFNSVHTKAGNYFEVYQIPLNEIQSSIAYVNDNEHDATAASSVTEASLPF